ncbi:MAG: hypothetical protein AAFQ65_15170 [Myxococcota bacterium]
MSEAPREVSWAQLRRLKTHSRRLRRIAWLILVVDVAFLSWIVLKKDLVPFDF